MFLNIADRDLPVTPLITFSRAARIPAFSAVFVVVVSVSESASVEFQLNSSWISYHMIILICSHSSLIQDQFLKRCSCKCFTIKDLLRNEAFLYQRGLLICNQNILKKTSWIKWSKRFSFSLYSGINKFFLWVYIRRITAWSGSRDTLQQS